MKKALFILGAFNDDDLNWIIHKAKKKVLLPEQTLIYEGRQIDALYIILSGNLKVVIESVGNKELAIISKGEVVGEISFIDTRPPLATVKAIEESVVLGIPRLELTLKLQQNTGFASRFYQGISLCLAERMRGTVQRLGYGVDLADIEKEPEELSPTLLNSLAIAQAKFNLLIQKVND